MVSPWALSQRVVSSIPQSNTSFVWKVSKEGERRGYGDEDGDDDEKEERMRMTRRRRKRRT